MGDTIVIGKLGWSQGLWSTDGRVITRHFFYFKGNELKSDKILSIMIDESGDFVNLDLKDPYYQVPLFFELCFRIVKRNAFEMYRNVMVDT